MPKFKVGDRVKFVGEACPDADPVSLVGEVEWVGVPGDKNLRDFETAPIYGVRTSDPWNSYQEWDEEDVQKAED
jgi:hypothetical protein